MNPYLKFVKQVEEGFVSAKKLPLGGIKSCTVETPAADAPKAMLFSPHPDDECITGLLPLRLMREAGMQIINVPITFGSKVERRPSRAAELKTACDFLGWEVCGRTGYQNLEKAEGIEILKAVQPAAVFMPHSKDWNSRHIATHFLVMDILSEMPPDFSCTVIETEYWGAMDDPNLMVEGDAKIVADLMAATSFHIEEVKRNPYHRSLPAWMQDNVRRGGELVGGQGSTAPDFTFATLYRLRRWGNGILSDAVKPGETLAMSDNLKELF